MNRKEFFKEQYSSESYFQKKYSMDHMYIDTTNLKWNKIFGDELKLFLFERGITKSKDIHLNNLHNEIDGELLNIADITMIGSEDNRIITSNKDSISLIMFDFIEKYEKLYHKFIKWLYKDVIKDKDFYFQRNPTIRVHSANAKTKFPKWHADSFIGHNPKEINVWFGLSDNKNSGFWVSNSVKQSKEWLSHFDFNTEEFIKESYGNNENFDEFGFNHSFEVKNIFNSLFLFDGRCTHTADYRTKDTRISIDIRIIPVDDYEWLIIDDEPLFKGIGRKKAEFRPGHKYGYHEKSAKELL